MKNYHTLKQYSNEEAEEVAEEFLGITTKILARKKWMGFFLSDHTASLKKHHIGVDSRVKE